MTLFQDTYRTTSVRAPSQITNIQLLFDRDIAKQAVLKVIIYSKLDVFVKVYCQNESQPSIFFSKSHSLYYCFMFILLIPSKLNNLIRV